MIDEKIISAVQGGWVNPCGISKFKARKRSKFMCFYFLRVKTKAPLKEIAERFDCKHPTVIYGTATHHKLVKKNSEYRNIFHKIENQLK